MKSGWTYILECSDGTYYTGVTSNLEKRLMQHRTGYFACFTSKKLPIKLKWSQEFSNIREAIIAEKQIKGWSRKKKDALIAGDYKKIHEYAQSKEMIERRWKRSSTPSQN